MIPAVIVGASTVAIVAIAAVVIVALVALIYLLPRGGPTAQVGPAAHFGQAFLANRQASP